MEPCTKPVRSKTLLTSSYHVLILSFDVDGVADAVLEDEQASTLSGEASCCPEQLSLQARQVDGPDGTGSDVGEDEDEDEEDSEVRG